MKKFRVSINRDYGYVEITAADEKEVRKICYDKVDWDRVITDEELYIEEVK